ncbi:MAG TPA: flagellar hook-basal body protein [Solirubrobacteraceae bacterium]|nr:flagellar hook-basal body protein [Solirubrobacteraceae bacterium]
MLDGMYAAAAGMNAEQQQLGAISNDLANASTTGYKSERVGFRDLLYSQVGQAGTSTEAGAGAAAEVLGRDHAQGAIHETGNPLDLAIQGEGFLSVKRANGSLALTRDGSLQLDARGRLTTAGGELVQPPITVPRGTPSSAVSIASDGTVTAAGRRLGRLQLLTVAAPDRLRAEGSNLFVATADSGAPRAVGAATTVRQGALETSNVDVAHEMVQMIDTQRSYQLQSSAIQTENQMSSIANELRS